MLTLVMVTGIAGAATVAGGAPAGGADVGDGRGGDEAMGEGLLLSCTSFSVTGLGGLGLGAFAPPPGAATGLCGFGLGKLAPPPGAAPRRTMHGQSSASSSKKGAHPKYMKRATLEMMRSPLSHSTLVQPPGRAKHPTHATCVNKNTRPRKSAPHPRRIIACAGTAMALAGPAGGGVSNHNARCTSSSELTATSHHADHAAPFI